jgi:hypothetical protein
MPRKLLTDLPEFIDSECEKMSLDGLLAQCDPSAPMPTDLQEWLDAKPYGSELV